MSWPRLWKPVPKDPEAILTYALPFVYHRKNKQYWLRRGDRVHHDAGKKFVLSGCFLVPLAFIEHYESYEKIKRENEV